MFMERVMYSEHPDTNGPIPTDGTELVGKAVQHGIALARRRIGAKATML
jgi:hypothetical protein